MPSAERKRMRERLDRSFRDLVWFRDRHRDRATGQLLYREHADWNFRGNVCHLRSKGAHHDLRQWTSNGVLLSDYNHQLSDGRGGRLLRLTDPDTGEPATDADKPIRFTLYDKVGKVLWMRVR